VETPPRRPRTGPGIPGGGQRGRAHQRRDVPAPAVAHHRQAGYGQVHAGLRCRPRTEAGPGPALAASKSTLQDGLYRYDAIDRLQDANLPERERANDLGRYIHLGPLGIALLPYEQPRVLLIDEIDKSDIDLPNDLLNVFEEGEFTIRELARHSQTQVEVRLPDQDAGATIVGGLVRCRAFPIVVLTSNGERDFPPAFLRRCVRLDLDGPDADRLARIVEAHLGPELRENAADVIQEFLTKRSSGDLATDQLLNAVFLTHYAPGTNRRDLIDIILRHISDAG
jgi:hypothetical protein